MLFEAKSIDKKNRIPVQEADSKGCEYVKLFLKQGEPQSPPTNQIIQNQFVMDIASEEYYNWGEGDDVDE